MDAVILAAGDGARLKGIAARGHKPLLLVNGVPLVVSVTRAALEYASHAFVITSPFNHCAINDLLEANELSGWTTIERGGTRGPGDSLLTGLCTSTADDVLVLCADNILSSHDVAKIVASRGEVVVGGRREKSPEAAQRFTRLDRHGKTVEGSNAFLVTTDQWSDGWFRIWLGPLRVPRLRGCIALAAAFTTLEEGAELKIGPHLAAMGDVTFVEVESYDVGVPEAWTS